MFVTPKRGACARPVERYERPRPSPERTRRNPTATAGGAGRNKTMHDREHKEQAALVKWASLQTAARPELAMLYAVPNGGHRHPATAARLKAEGVRRGVPDLCLPVARGGFHGLYVELKAEGGRPTVEQRAWIEALRALGYRAEVCVGWERAKAVIEEYLAREM
jgi:hypothetical protein